MVLEMDQKIKKLAEQSGFFPVPDETEVYWEYRAENARYEKFAELIIEETLAEVDERVYGRGENQWYYDVDKNWVRLHFGYGELHDKINHG